MPQFRLPPIPLLAALAVLIGGIGALVRIHGTLAEPLWLDEAYSAYAAAQGFSFLWHVVPQYETHPPFYYSLLRLWTLPLGDSLASLRALGILCGIATIGVMALAGREIARWRRLPPVPLIAAAAAIGAISPVMVEMSREVRPYPVLILTYTLAIFALVRIAARIDATGTLPRRPLALYTLCLSLILWLHNLGPLYAAALGLAGLALVARPGLGARQWRLFLGGHALAGLIYLPAFLIMLGQAPTWIRSTWLHFNPATLPARLPLIYVVSDMLGLLAAALLVALAIVALARGGGGGRRLLLALLILAILPVAASIALSIAIAPVFIPRTMSAVAVPTALLIAIGVAGARGIWRGVALAALALLLVRMGSMDAAARANTVPQQDWYRAVAWLAERWRPGDVVWAYPNEGALPFDYAVRDRGLPFVTRPIPTAIPTLDGGPGSWNPTGSRGVVSLPRDRLIALAGSPSAQAVPTIWLLRLGANAYDKQDRLLNALAARRVKVADCESYPIDLIGLARPDAVRGPVPPFPKTRARCVPRP